MTSRSAITINSSIKCSASSATHVKDLVTNFDDTCIYSCVLGISSIKTFFGETIAKHTALLLSNKKSRELRKKGGLGILIEYGEYAPSMCEEEKKYEKNGYVIYRYKDKGGLRYYAKDFKEFKNEFGDIGYVNLDIDQINQKTFTDFIDKCAPENEFKWIKKNYNLITFNCQTFTAHALSILKPEYDERFIDKGIKTNHYEENESIIPKCILKILHELEKSNS